MENLKSQILEDLKIAMKEKNSSKLEAVRACKSAIDKFEKENLANAPEGQVMSAANYAKALKPLVKQREDSIAQFKIAGNQELADKETTELEVINSYLVKVMPKQFSKEEMESVAKKYASENSLGKSDMGKIMSYFKSTFDGQYDGKELSAIAKNILV
jgi:uncharacterized protein YqeY